MKSVSSYIPQPQYSHTINTPKYVPAKNSFMGAGRGSYVPVSGQKNNIPLPTRQNRYSYLGGDLPQQTVPSQRSSSRPLVRKDANQKFQTYSYFNSENVP